MADYQGFASNVLRSIAPQPDNFRQNALALHQLRASEEDRALRREENALNRGFRERQLELTEAAGKRAEASDARAAAKDQLDLTERLLTGLNNVPEAQRASVYPRFLEHAKAGGIDVSSLSGDYAQDAPLLSQYAAMVRQTKDRAFQTVTTADGVFTFNPADGTLGQRLGGRPVNPSEQAGGMFGNSAEARAVQHLIDTGQLTPQQAAQWIAGKTAVGPNGQLDFVTPGAVGMGASPPPGQSAQPGVSPIRAANPVKPTEGQNVAAGFASRMERAEAEMQRVQAQGFDPASGLEAARAGVPLVGNYLASSEFQQNRQAQEDWVRAKLRKESGAVIGPQEMADEINTYFPKPGDSPEVIAQKARARQTALEAMHQQSGPAAPAQAAPQAPQAGAPRMRAVNPQTGAAVVYNPQTGQWEPE